MKIDFDTLDSFDDWSSALQQILGQARAAVQSREVQKRVEAQQLLADFISQSPNRIARELDDIARKAMDDILNKAVDEALLSLSSRTADLALHAKTVSEIAAQAEAKAASIRLERAQQVISSATETVASFKQLRQTLVASAVETLVDQGIVGKIDEALVVIEGLLPLVQQIRGPAERV